MPTYVYETTDTSKPVRRFEVQQRMSEAALTQDPATGEPVRRVISGGLGFIAPKGDAQPMCGTGACGLPECAPPSDAHVCPPNCAMH
jgi:hypothetical protein